MDSLSVAANVLYYIAYPIFYIIYLILTALTIITAPLLHLGHYFLYALYYPIHVLGKFETLYIFLGVAVLVGGLTGTSLHYASGFLASLLNLESYNENQQGRTLASYRKEKHDEGKIRQASSPGSGDPAIGDSISAQFDASLKEEPLDYPKRGRETAKNGFIPSTILEEDSTEDDF